MRLMKTRWKAERIAEYSGLSSMIRSKRRLKSVITRIGLERGNRDMADIITQAEPDTFAVDILKGRCVKSSFETIEYYTMMDACVRNKDSMPYESSPILPKKLIAPRN